MACGSNILAAFQAAGLIAAGANELALVGGSESMTHVQVGLTQPLSDWLREIRGAHDWQQRLQHVRSLPASQIGL